MQNKKITDFEFKKLQNSVAAILAKTENLREVYQLFEDLLTPAEFRGLAIRWEILKQLADGISQRKIAENLGVSTSNTTRGVRVLENPKSFECKQLKQKKNSKPDLQDQ